MSCQRIHPRLSQDEGLEEVMMVFPISRSIHQIQFLF